MDEFDDGGEADGLGGGLLIEAAGDEEEDGAEAFAAVALEVLGDLGDGLDAGDGLEAELLLHALEILRDEVLNFTRAESETQFAGSHRLPQVYPFDRLARKPRVSQFWPVWRRRSS